MKKPALRLRRRRDRQRLFRELPRMGENPWVPTGYFSNRPWLLKGNEIGRVESVRFVLSKLGAEQPRRA